MLYDIQFKPGALRDLQSLAKLEADRILARLERMRRDLLGDVKKLTGFTPEYRLRVGDYRVLFELEGNRVVVYRVVHRRDAYR